MRPIDLIRLLSLAAIWGASFLFMRVIAPVLGPLWTAELRVGIAGLVMLAFMLATRQAMRFKTNWRQYLLIGGVNSALPAALYAYAALTLPSGYSAIVNATTPLWGALVGIAVLGETMTLRKAIGLLIGISGVALLVRLGPVTFTPQVLLAALACALAAICYACSGAYSKLRAAGIPPGLMATGSQLGAALVLIPVVPLSPIRGELTPHILLLVVVLAVLCSAVAYFLYFRLLADIGPTRSMTVTFLIPLFALLWGALFLGEVINQTTLAGCALVVLATWLVTAGHSKSVPGKSR
ncbi:DMT family transporter [Actimicrobium sp. CCI2.3]|uniref:DMT family transporter n=1 Tax=Actimicrobium sp. CCI2.3 TaxID=3048616 RepID=UPI002AB365CE|nr:DMT family transporter [Actimicrobium sp. CCI2.3]MDY7576402.1 DMT family transporter [Actimicrobium sp. CCI2.3]MEB0024069.1 DMT family transporter [Actimicrobium sp. CCI2.3]